MRAVRQKSLPPPVPLPVGTRLGRFELRGVLGSGPFGITYRGLDPDSDEDVVVKEYLPPSLAHREGTLAVLPNDEKSGELFQEGLRFFVNEGDLLPRFEHPALVRVLACWQANGTAYMAMPLLVGRDMQQMFQALSKPPREAPMRALLDTLLGAVETLHRAKVEHRDISPRSIMILANGGLPVLMDMGSPRRVTAARGDTGPTGPREGYAAIELYGKDNGLERGPWTDLYALGAVMYWLIAGKAPPAAPQRHAGERLAKDLLRPDKRHSSTFVAIIDWMLAVSPRDRPQSVAELRAVLQGKPLPAAYASGKRTQAAGTGGKGRRRWLVGGAVAAVLAAAGGGAGWWAYRSGRLRWKR